MSRPPLWRPKRPEQTWITRHPGRARAIYYKNSRAGAIAAKCVDCAGSAREAALCPCEDCPLWTMRPGAEKGVLPDGAPREAQLKALVETPQDERPV